MEVLNYRHSFMKLYQSSLDKVECIYTYAVNMIMAWQKLNGL